MAPKRLCWTRTSVKTALETRHEAVQCFVRASRLSGADTKVRKSLFVICASGGGLIADVTNESSDLECTLSSRRMCSVDQRPGEYVIRPALERGEPGRCRAEAICFCCRLLRCRRWRMTSARPRSNHSGETDHKPCLDLQRRS